MANSVDKGKAGIRRLGVALFSVVIGFGVIILSSRETRLIRQSGRISSVDNGEASGSVAPIIPEETADVEALMELVDWNRMPVFRDGLYRQQSSAEKKATARPTSAYESADGNRDMNNFICASANADYQGRGRFPFIMELESCPEDYVKGFVLARFTGSGRFVRLWLTTSSLFKLQYSDEILRFYLDDCKKPIIQLPLIDAISAKRYPIFAPPFGAGGRYHLAWYYPVVFESKLIITLDRLRLSESYYHQTDVVLDREARRRKASGKRLDLRRVAAATLAAENGSDAGRQITTLRLRPGDRQIVFDLKGPQTVDRIALNSDTRENLASLWLRVFWDEMSDPAVDLPLLALFASEFALPEKNSLVLGAKRNSGGSEIWLRLPMPFRSRALWTLENRGDRESDLSLSVETTRGVPKGEWGYFRVQRFETRGPTRARAHSLVKAKGRGRLVGVCITMEGLGLDPDEKGAHPLNFLEGDETGTIDGTLAITGTGTEDYFNNSFYFADGAYATAFAQAQKSESESGGAVVACRWHILSDAIDFITSLDFDLEIGADNSSMLDRYRSVAFLYKSLSR